MLFPVRYVRMDILFCNYYLMAEKPNNDTEDKKISEKPDAIKKAEDIAIKYPDLDVKET